MRKVTIVALIALGFPGLIFYLGCMHYQRAHHVAIMWNRLSGQFWLQEDAGFHASSPWVFAAKIDTRPERVCIASASRSFNCKLVKFNPVAYLEFVAVEGTRYYWWDNRVSFNLGYDEEYRGMRDLLRGYAYSLKQYPFIVSLRDYEEATQ